MKLLVCERGDEGKSNMWRGERRGVESRDDEKETAACVVCIVISNDT
jgi:hypothetical protein